MRCNLAIRLIMLRSIVYAATTLLPLSVFAVACAEDGQSSDSDTAGQGSAGGSGSDGSGSGSDGGGSGETSVAIAGAAITAPAL